MKSVLAVVCKSSVCPKGCKFDCEKRVCRQQVLLMSVLQRERDTCGGMAVDATSGKELKATDWQWKF